MSGREMVVKPQQDHHFRLLKQQARQRDRCCRQKVASAAWLPREIRNPRRWHSYAPRFWTGSRRTEHKFQPRCRSDSHDAMWFVASPKAFGAALVTHNGFHGISYGCGLIIKLACGPKPGES